jgi:hypothetical protein
MIARTHVDQSTGRFHVTYHRQGWREWISFYCDPDYLEEFRQTPFSWLYIALHQNTFASRNLQMVLAPIALFIVAGRLLSKLWSAPARLFYRHGWLAKVVPGEQVHWFWFRYIARKQNA